MSSHDKEGGYDVGYAKPPKSTRFEKGRSGNPKGRPKGAKSLRTILEEMGRKRIKITSNGRTKVVSMLEAMVMQLGTQAVKGDMKAIREVFAAHRILLEPEQVAEAITEVHERDATVMKNLLKRMNPTGSNTAADRNTGEEH